MFQAEGWNLILATWVSSPSPNLHLNANNSIEYELMWGFQIIVSYIKCLRSEISPFLGISGTIA